jgi:hypothetical protein
MSVDLRKQRPTAGRRTGGVFRSSATRNQWFQVEFREFEFTIPGVEKKSISRQPHTDTADTWCEQRKKMLIEKG